MARTARPRTARAAVFEGPGLPLVLRDLPLPEPGPGEARVRVDCCTLCGSDLHTYRGDRTTPVPTVLGHEIVGTIDALPEDDPPLDVGGAPLAPGQRVVWSVAASCGWCATCRRGLPQKCESLFKYGHERLVPSRELSGGLADACLLVRGTAIVAVPDEVADLAAAPASCATATVAAALREGGVSGGDAVAIHGAGMLGLTACAMARARGASRVIAADPDAERASLTLGFGATVSCSPSELDDAVGEATGGRGVDVHLELSGAPEAAAQGLGLLRVGGTAVWVGAVSPTDAVPVDPEHVVRRLLRVVGVHNYRPDDLVAAVRFLGEQSATALFEDLVEETFALEDAGLAFERAAASSAPRVAVTPR